MPAVTVADPATSIVIGAIAFHELLGRSALDITGQISGFLIMVLATIELARRNQETPGGAIDVSTPSDSPDVEAELPA